MKDILRLKLYLFSQLLQFLMCYVRRLLRVMKIYTSGSKLLLAWHGMEEKKGGHLSNNVLRHLFSKIDWKQSLSLGRYKAIFLANFSLMFYVIAGSMQIFEQEQRGL